MQAKAVPVFILVIRPNLYRWKLYAKKPALFKAAAKAKTSLFVARYKLHIGEERCWQWKLRLRPRCKNFYVWMLLKRAGVKYIAMYDCIIAFRLPALVRCCFPMTSIEIRFSDFGSQGDVPLRLALRTKIATVLSLRWPNQRQCNVLGAKKHLTNIWA